MKRTEDMTIPEAHEELELVDEEIQRLFLRRKELKRRINEHRPLLELMGAKEEKGALL